MSDRNTVDYDLDVWIDENVYKRKHTRRFTAPAYTKYTNRALHILEDLEIPFTVGRTADLMFEVRLYHCVETVKTWEELAMAICKVVFKLMTRRNWRE
jgi:hypothetical protein